MIVGISSGMFYFCSFSSPQLILSFEDRGLCGGIHSTITREIKQILAEDPKSKIFIVGDKVRGQLVRFYPGNICGVFSDVGKKVINKKKEMSFL